MATWKSTTIKTFTRQAVITAAVVAIVALSAAFGSRVTAVHAQTADLGKGGHGSASAGTFNNSSGQFAFCFRENGSRPDGSTSNAHPAVIIERVTDAGMPAGTTANVDFVVISDGGCQDISLEPGMYEVGVIAPDWTTWGIGISVIQNASTGQA